MRRLLSNTKRNAGMRTKKRELNKSTRSFANGNAENSGILCYKFLKRKSTVKKDFTFYYTGLELSQHLLTRTSFLKIRKDQVCYSKTLKLDF